MAGFCQKPKMASREKARIKAKENVIAKQEEEEEEEESLSTTVFCLFSWRVWIEVSVLRISSNVP